MSLKRKFARLRDLCGAHMLNYEVSWVECDDTFESRTSGPGGLSDFHEVKKAHSLKHAVTRLIEKLEEAYPNTVVGEWVTIR